MEVKKKVINDSICSNDFKYNKMTKFDSTLNTKYTGKPISNSNDNAI